MNTEEINWWVKFLAPYPEVEIDYAFDRWLEQRTAEEWWPTAQRIAELCSQYRVVERQKLLPIGCERCDWTGFYLTKASRTIEGNENREGQELAQECPCVKDASLRTPCLKRKATEEELRVMWTLVWEMCAGKPGKPGDPGKKKPEQMSGLVPTARELAEQLGKLKPAQRTLIENVRKKKGEE